MLGVINIDGFLSFPPSLQGHRESFLIIWIIAKLVLGAWVTFGAIKALSILIVLGKKEPERS